MATRITIRLRLLLLVAFYSILLIGGSFLGIGGMSVIRGSLESVYAGRTVPLQQLSEMHELLLKNRLAIVGAVLQPTPEVISANTDALERGVARIDELWGAYSATRMTAEEKTLASRFELDRKRLVDEGLRPAVAKLRAGDVSATEAQLRTTIRPLFEPVENDLNALIKLQTNVARNEYQDASRLYTTLRNVAIAGVAVALLLGVAVGTAIARALSSAVRASVRVASRIARGELNNRIEVTRTDELGELLGALRTMNDGLRAIVGEVRDGASAVANASAEIARGNADLSSRTEEQASTLEQTASSMEELTTTVKQNADNARQANQLAMSAAETASRGGHAMAEVVATMEGIAQSSGRIADIIAVIDGIAFQTNILALNAAVEAARAGEQGRGFAVVATEVRALAQRSAAAAREIKSLIETSVARVGEGTRQVQEAGETIADITTGAQRVSEVISEIAAASHEQLQGIEQVSRAIAQMDRVVQQNAALVEESAAAAENMSSEADGLVKSVERFKLGDAEAARRAAATRLAAAPTPARQQAARAAVPSDAPRAKLARPADTADGEWKEF